MSNEDCSEPHMTCGIPVTYYIVGGPCDGTEVHYPTRLCTPY